MRSLQLKLVLLACSSLFVVACGTPKAGDKCDTAGFLCSDSTTALECKVGAWVSLPCKGVAGCTRTNDVVKCDMSGNVEGDACASSAVGKGLCAAGGTATLECRDDGTGAAKLVKTNTCRSCSIQGDNVVCQP
jgi:hypothetical protein